MSASSFPWLSALAEVAREARLAFEETAAAVGDVVLHRPDEVHIHPCRSEFAGVQTLTLRRGGASQTIEATAYLAAAAAPTLHELEQLLGKANQLPVAPDQIGERDYRMPAPVGRLPEGTSCIATVGRGDRVSAFAIEVPAG